MHVSEHDDHQRQHWLYRRLWRVETRELLYWRTARPDESCVVGGRSCDTGSKTHCANVPFVVRGDGACVPAFGVVDVEEHLLKRVHVGHPRRVCLQQLRPALKSNSVREESARDRPA